MHMILPNLGMTMRRTFAASVAVIAGGEREGAVRAVLHVGP